MRIPPWIVCPLASSLYSSSFRVLTNSACIRGFLIAY